MFNWKRYAGFSLICASECRLSHSRSLKLSPLLFPISTSFSPSLLPLCSPLLCLSELQNLPPSCLPPPVRLLLLFPPLLGLSFFSRLISLLSLPDSYVYIFSPPPELSARSYDGLMSRSSPAPWCVCALIHACVLERHRLRLLCEFDTSKGCHELDKSIPCSVLHWQN